MKNANPVYLAALVLGFLLLAGCGPVSQDPGPGATPKTAGAKTIADWFEIRVGARTVRMQLAISLPEMQQGLMHRRDLGADDGMLFVYERPQKLVFWMKNTPTALDIAYFNPDGSLAEVYPAFPFDEREVPSRSERLQFVLEMKQGWFAQKGVRAGDKLDLEAVKAALRARGYDPAKFGF